MNRHRALLATSCLLAAALTAPAHAGGFEYTENGARVLGRAGAFSARADDPMAIAYNPAGLTLWRGHMITLALQLEQLDMSFERAGADDLIPGLYPSATIENEEGPFFAPSLAWGYGGGDWGVGFGVYGPGSYGYRKYPLNGPNQYILTESDVLLAFITAAGAYKPIKELSIGVSLQYTVMPLAKFSLAVDGAVVGSPTEGICDPNADPQCRPNSFRTQADLDVSDWTAFTAIVGVHWAPYEFLEFAIVSRVLPVWLDATGTIELSGLSLIDNGSVALVDKACGTADSSYDASLPGCKPNNGASMKLLLPPWLRVGVRYIDRDAAGRELFDIELDVVAEFWEMLDKYEIGFDGTMKFLTGVTPLNGIDLPKNFRNTLAVRVGSDMHLIPDLFTLRAGLHFETAASPLAYSNIDFLAFERVGAALGMSFYMGPVELAVAYQLVWQPERTVPVDEGKIVMQRPLTETAPSDLIVVNAGTYNSMFHTASLTAAVWFD
jgi:long-chain fatty acid transport protein